MKKASYIILYILIILIFAPTNCNSFWIWTPESNKWGNPKYSVKETPAEQLDFSLGFYEEKSYEEAIKELKKCPPPLSKDEIESIKRIEAEIPLKISHLSEKDWKAFSELFTYNTNAIEGSRLNQKEVNDLLETDKWPEKSKEDIAEALGVNEAISYIRTTKEHISIDLIKDIHKIVFRNSKFFAGKFRKKGEEVVVIDSNKNIVHKGASQERINHLLNELVKWYNKHKNKP